MEEEVITVFSDTDLLKGILFAVAFLNGAILILLFRR